MLASSAVEIQFGVEGHSPSDGVPYKSCTPERRQQIGSSSNSINAVVGLLKCPADDKLQEVVKLSQTAESHAMCTACVPSFCGLGAAPNVNRAPRTPMFTLCNTSSLYSEGRSRKSPTWLICFTSLYCRTYDFLHEPTRRASDKACSERLT